MLRTALSAAPFSDGAVSLMMNEVFCSAIQSHLQDDRKTSGTPVPQNQKSRRRIRFGSRLSNPFTMSNNKSRQTNITQSRKHRAD
jgi:hypothetical protein